VSVHVEIAAARLDHGAHGERVERALEREQHVDGPCLDELAGRAPLRPQLHHGARWRFRAHEPREPAGGEDDRRVDRDLRERATPASLGGESARRFGAER
jgi:hypothetical protein